LDDEIRFDVENGLVVQVGWDGDKWLIVMKGLNGKV